MNVKAIFLVIILFIVANVLSAQQTLVKGKAWEADGKTPVEFANILLLKQDSSYISGTNSDLEGYFEISNTSKQGSLISVSFMGYETAYVPITGKTDTLEIFLSPSSIALNEVAIQGRSVIVKNDRKVILPSEEQIKMSTDGVDMIRKMQLPRIMVDPVSGEVTMSGNGEVQLRINGVQVTSAEIASIPPADVLRVEYHDDPGIRYGNAGIVINYITRRKESGGNVNGVLFNGGAHKRRSMDNRLSLKYNQGKSEWSANAVFVQRKQDWTREYDEKLISPDATIHRLEIGEPTPFNKKVFSTNVNYSLTEKDSYFFNAQLRYTYNDFPNSYEDRRSKLYVSGSDDPMSIFDHTVERSNSPALDLYYERKLKNGQSLIFNLVGTYIDTDSRRIYQEKQENDLTVDLFPGSFHTSLRQ